MYRELLSVLALAASVNGAAHEIAVGQGGALKFDPAEIDAAVGDTLVFRFYGTSGPHDVVSGDFETPCAPRAGAFYSGSIEGDDDGNEIFTVEVTSTDPLYFYCSVNRHCQSGMAGAVNARPERGVSQYVSAARQADQASRPADPTGGVVTTRTGGDDGGSSTTSSGTATASQTTAVTTTGSATGSPTGTGGSAGLTGASNTSPTPTSSPAATTTPNVAPGRKSEGVVLGGLAAVLGGFVALMA